MPFQGLRITMVGIITGFVLIVTALSPVAAGAQDNARILDESDRQRAARARIRERIMGERAAREEIARARVAMNYAVVGLSGSGVFQGPLLTTSMLYPNCRVTGNSSWDLELAKFDNDLDPGSRITQLMVLLRIAVRDRYLEKCLARVVLEESGFYFYISDAKKSIEQIRNGLKDRRDRIRQFRYARSVQIIDPEEPFKKLELEDNNRGTYLKASINTIEILGADAAHDITFEFLKDKSSRKFGVRTFALQILAEEKFDQPKKETVLTFARNKDIEPIARELLVSKLAAYRGPKDTDVVEVLNEVLLDATESVRVRKQAAIALEALSRTDPNSLKYLESLAMTRLNDPRLQKDVSGALKSVIEAVLKTRDPSVIRAAAKQLRPPLTLAIGILKNKKERPDRLIAAIEVIGEIGRVTRHTNPGVLSEAAVPALMNTFAMNRILVAQSIAHIGPAAFNGAYGDICAALSNCTLEERVQFLAAISAIAPFKR